MLIVILYFILALSTGDSNDGVSSGSRMTIFNFPIGGSKHIKDLIAKTAIQEVDPSRFREQDLRILCQYYEAAHEVFSSSIEGAHNHHGDRTQFSALVSS